MLDTYTVKLFKSDGEALVCAGDNKFRITMADYLLSGVCDGDAVDDESICFLEAAAEKLSCIKKAFVYLSYRSLPVRKLKSKLKLTGFSENAIEKAVELLLKKGYLDDCALCKEYAFHLKKSKLFGVSRLKKELFLKGFDAECIEETLENMADDDEEDAEDALKQLLAKKFPSLSSDDREGRAKAVAYLYRMGYTYDDINNAISALGRD